MISGCIALSWSKEVAYLAERAEGLLDALVKDAPWDLDERQVHELKRQLRVWRRSEPVSPG